jgi:outer membrane protein OmpA-like peptidoglycan-associated protein
MRFFHILVIVFVILSATAALANPGQTGSTGLINVPSADTLDYGNISIGAWSNYSRNSNQLQKNALIVPVSITIGIGTFWEVYGAYPNILFNADEDTSGRGTMDIGTKLRFLGSRDSLFKMAADFLAQRHVSENMAVDGATDLSTKLIASYSKGNAGIHLYGGYLFPGSVKGVAKDNEILFGAGLEYMLLARLKVSGEVTGIAGRRDDYSMEASGGLQYYLSPHLTLNASAGTGFGNNDPEMRFVFGISSCQGVGSYVMPIPHVGKKTIDNKQKAVLKQLKIIPISTLLLKASSPQTKLLTKLEVEVDADKEDVIIKPYGQITIAPQQASSNLTSAGTSIKVPLRSRDEEISLNLPRKTLDNEASAIDYTMDTIRGITPLYEIDVKGSQTAIPAVVVLPERMTVYRKFRFPDVTFGFDQWTLSNEGIKMLSEVADQIRKDKKGLYLKVDGHTDAIGSLPYNMDLSLKRAIAVATYLINHEGIEASKIFIKGFGKSTAIADNSTVDGRRKNRRTEILFLVGKAGQ